MWSVAGKVGRGRATEGDRWSKTSAVEGPSLINVCVYKRDVFTGSTQYTINEGRGSLVRPSEYYSKAQNTWSDHQNILQKHKIPGSRYYFFIVRTFVVGDK